MVFHYKWNIIRYEFLNQHTYLSKIYNPKLWTHLNWSVSYSEVDIMGVLLSNYIKQTWLLSSSNSIFQLIGLRYAFNIYLRTMAGNFILHVWIQNSLNANVNVYKL